MTYRLSWDTLPLRRVLATLVTAARHSCRWPLSPFGQRLAVVILLSIQAGLLAYSATRHSPTHLEPAFLASGISHWQFGRFELYRVNPPLVRMIAALPVLAVGCETDWSRYHDGPGSRAEFTLGEAFIKANGPGSIPLFFYARWACIPFNLIGSFFAYRWARDLYGGGAGLLAMTLYVFEPNLLAHGELITPDGACTAFGILAGYTFWRWLKAPTWSWALLAGGALGLAELSKMSWLILFPLWPLLWLAWRTLAPTTSHQSQANLSTEQPLTPAPCQPPATQLIAILVIGVYLINLGYAFDGSFTQLKQFRFVSTSLTGLSQPGMPGNRFQGTWLGELPMPVPKQFVLGFDSQKKDFESFGQPSYLRGEWKDGGWWYYYLYGLLVKVPCGTWGLLALTILLRIFTRDRPVPLRHELVLLVPAVALLALVSSQTEFNHHLRYVFPSLGLGLAFLGQLAGGGSHFTGAPPKTQLAVQQQPANLETLRCSEGFESNLHSETVKQNSQRIWLQYRGGLRSLAVSLLLLYSIVSALLVYPHHLAYFNDFVGGPKNGYKHLLGSSLDWGQDVILSAEYCRRQKHSTVQLHTDNNDVIENIVFAMHDIQARRFTNLTNNSNLEIKFLTTINKHLHSEGVQITYTTKLITNEYKAILDHPKTN